MSTALQFQNTGWGTRTRPLPPIGEATITDLRPWVDEGIYYEHLGRSRDVANWRRAELYDECLQWLWRAHAGYDVTGLSQWVQVYWEPNDPNRIPTPVFNDGLGARQNESARLARPDYRPHVRPKARAGTKVDLSQRLGARRLEDSLRHRLEMMGWDEESQLAHYHMPVYGGVWLFSLWEERWDDTTIVPVSGAVACEGCGAVFASEDISEDQYAGIFPKPGGPVPPVGPTEGGGLRLQGCPECGAGVGPYAPSYEEARERTDRFGRSLGAMRPRGDWIMRVASPYDVFPRNLGYDTRPDHVDDVVFVHVEHLDWVALRYPEHAGKVNPENPALLTRYHPIAGAPDLYPSLPNARLFHESVRVKERHKRPWMERKETPGGIEFRMNYGRSTVIAGDQVLFDAPFVMPSANFRGQYVDRQHVEYVPWELRSGGRRLNGLSQWEVMFDAQDTENETVSQTQAVRRRLALPMYAASRQMDFEIGPMRAGLPGFLAEFNFDPNGPTQLPGLINNATIAPGVERETEFALEYIRRMGHQEVEQGSVPAGVDAASAIRQLKESAGQKREPRIKRYGRALQRLYSHGAALQQHLYDQPREIRSKDEAEGQEVWAYVQGSDFGTDIVVEVKPREVEADEQRVLVRDAVGAGVLDPKDQRKARKIARYLEVPDDLYEDDDLQIQSAEREWIRFRDHGETPYVDPTLDDNLGHYQEHGRDAHSEFFRELEVRADWDGVLQAIGDTWHTDLQGLIAPPPMMIPPPPPGAPPGAAPPMPPTIAPPGPPGCLQNRIRAMWMQKLQLAMFIPQDAAALDAVLNWRAHIEAHRLEEERKQMIAQGQPVLASPGAKATPSGTQPTPLAGPADQEQSAIGAQLEQQSQIRSVSAGGVPAGLQTQPEPPEV